MSARSRAVAIRSRVCDGTCGVGYGERVWARAGCVRSRDTEHSLIKSGAECDLDEILRHYRESNQPILLNVGGLRFRLLTLNSKY